MVHWHGIVLKYMQVQKYHISQSVHPSLNKMRNVDQLFCGGEYGISKPLHFVCLPSYWRGLTKKKPKLDQTNLINDDTEQLLEGGLIFS
jgi:hypothetical protein